MRRTISAILMTTACLIAQAQTGKISGKVVNKEGKPVVGAKINLKLIYRAWSKDLFTDKNGNYFQVGLEPKEYDFTVSAEGYVDLKERIKIPLSEEPLIKKFTLLTPEQARAEAVASGAAQAVPEDPGAPKDAECRENFNLAIPVYNEGKFSEALPFIDKAYKAGTEALTLLKDEQAKTDLAPELPKIERVLGICMAQAGEKKADAEPYLLKALEKNAKDEPVIAGLIETSKAKGDKAAEQKYTAMLEALHGPNPDLIYNKGVEAFNAGKNAEAKAQLVKLLELDPKYAKAYYLLGMIEYANMNMKGTKQNFLKYLETAPTGDKAAEIKEMLKDPSLKNIK
ncbi:MAG TPA: carboxypeptidase regulatory-like domain-containing protein [Geothrix sp.]|nr:carboxypeptidase regulatory-like domain-containing protein [Geothrix sp.]